MMMAGACQKRTRVLWGVLCSLLGIGSACGADLPLMELLDHKNIEPERIEIAEMEAQLGTMYVLQELGLSGSQRKRLLAVRKQLVPVSAKYVTQRKSDIQAAAVALGEFIPFCTRKGEFPPKNPKDLWRLGGMGARRNFFNAAGSVAEPFGKVLTSRQTEALKALYTRREKLVGVSYVFPASHATDDETDPMASESARGQARYLRSYADGTMTRAAFLCVAPYLEEVFGITDSRFPRWWDMSLHAASKREYNASSAATFTTGLQLQREQLEAISEVLHDELPRTGIVAPFQEDLGTPEARRYLRDLRKAMAVLKRGKSFPADDMAELYGRRRAWQRRQGKRKDSRKGTTRSREAVRKIVGTVRKTLTKSQLTRIAISSHCPFPISSTFRTTRAGSVAGDGLHEVAQILDAARKRDDWGSGECRTWWQKKARGLYDPYNQMKAQEKTKSLARALHVAEQARGLSDLEYLRLRKKLCQELVELNPAFTRRDAATRKGLETPQGQRRETDKVLYDICYGRGLYVSAFIDGRLAFLNRGRTRLRR
jgi:hypothetical protein